MDYSRFHVKEFSHRSLYVHKNQCYLGRCYLWCNRADAFDLSDATVQEWAQLRMILRQVPKKLGVMFQPDMLNYAFLGNVTHHLHGHMIPRYSRPIELQGLTFEDKRWGKNY